MPRKQNAHDHGDDAQDRKRDGIAQIHRGLFTARWWDVKAREEIFLGLVAQ